MAELTIRPEEIRAALDSFVESYTPSGAAREEVGRVTLAGDGIAQVEGLPGAMASELLEFEDGTLGLALNLDVREIGVVGLGEFTGIEEGQVVRRTGELAEHDDADLPDVEVERKAQRAVLELQQLVGHRTGQALHLCDPVAREGDPADLFASRAGGRVGLDEAVQRGPDLLGPDRQLSHRCSLLS